MKTSDKRGSVNAHNDVLHSTDASETLRDELRVLMSRYGLNEKEINDWLSHRAEELETLHSEVLAKMAGTP